MTGTKKQSPGFSMNLVFICKKLKSIQAVITVRFQYVMVISRVGAFSGIGFQSCRCHDLEKYDGIAKGNDWAYLGILQR